MEHTMESASAYLTTLLVLHVLGAIVGVGPSFTFGVIGSMMPSAGAGAVTLLELMLKIEKVLLNPLGLALLPVTGILLIIETNRDQAFFSHTWLWISVLAYVIIVVLSLGVASPGIRKLLGMMKEGKAGSPEFNGLVATQMKLGPVFTVLTLVIIVLMVWQPGDPL